MKKLLVIVPDAPSAILMKGEYQPLYYNPGEVFDEVHMLLMNDDQPDIAQLQMTVGRANLHVHNFKPPLFRKTLGFRAFFMRIWARQAVEITKKVNPSLIRCYGHSAVTFAASEIKRRLKIPYVVSLHGNPDVDYLRGRLALSMRQRLEGVLVRQSEIIGLRCADMVLPVYSPITEYLDDIGVVDYRLAYNILAKGMISRDSYNVDSDRIRVVCIGRQMPDQKDPKHIIDSLVNLPNVDLTLVGDGLLHETLVDRANNLRIADRIRFIRNLSNDKALRLLVESDIFIYHSVNYEISKGTMEAALLGMPIILNERTAGLAKELLTGNFMIVEDSKSGYENGIKRLIKDDSLRERLGRGAATQAWATWDPEKMEKQIIQIYKKLANFKE